MPDKPAAEVMIDEPLVRALVAAQASTVIGDAGSLSLRKVAEGWDSEIWRLGRDHAVRLPRRALAAPLICHEQAALSVIAPALRTAGIEVPVPVVSGQPDAQFPWAWSIVPWITGTPGLDVPRNDRGGWVATLAAALRALHRPAPPGHPRNPVRGVPLAARDRAVTDRLATLRSAGTLGAAESAALEAVWRRGLAAPGWHAPPVWIHGDLHPGNLIADGGRLVGIIDFGDVTAGDPAYDLAVAWLAFDAPARLAFIDAVGTDDPTAWTRAHAWAAATCVLLLAHSDDNPDYARFAHEAAAEVIGEAPHPVVGTSV